MGVLNHNAKLVGGPNPKGKKKLNLQILDWSHFPHLIDPFNHMTDGIFPSAIRTRLKQQAQEALYVKNYVRHRSGRRIPNAK